MAGEMSLPRISSALHLNAIPDYFWVCFTLEGGSQELPRLWALLPGH